MFGWGKKKKDAEAEDAFGHTEQTTQTTTGVTVTSTASMKADPLGPATQAQLGGLLGAIHDAVEESGGDPEKLRVEIKENLAERGIAANIQEGGSPTVITSSFGGLVSPEDAMLARLEKLGQLKAQGLLTEEEFAAQKAKILGSS